MDVLSTPRRPHKSPAHTVKDRILAKLFLLSRPADISSEGAAYYTTFFETVNTFLKIFSKGFRGSGPSILPAAAPIEGGRILHPISDSSTPRAKLFESAMTTASEARSSGLSPRKNDQRRGANPTTKFRF